MLLLPPQAGPTGSVSPLRQQASTSRSTADREAVGLRGCTAGAAWASASPRPPGLSSAPLAGPECTSLHQVCGRLPTHSLSFPAVPRSPPSGKVTFAQCGNMGQCQPVTGTHCFARQSLGQGQQLILLARCVRRSGGRSGKGPLALEGRSLSLTRVFPGLDRGPPAQGPVERKREGRDVLCRWSSCWWSSGEDEMPSLSPADTPSAQGALGDQSCSAFPSELGPARLRP